MNSDKTILSLDAGGTNFVFSALKGGETIGAPVRLESNADNLDLCLNSIFNGFEQLIKQNNLKADAISFAFPGPADYENGVIGDLYNLPAFRDGVPLAGILEDHFNLPVFINNDGNLFAYGEAKGGFLPALNKKLEKAGSSKVYNNLIGVTLGTGFGAGISINGNLLQGDNFAAGELWASTNKIYPNSIVEESVSIRAIKRVYAELASILIEDCPTPEEIYKIAKGISEGDKEAAIASFETFSTALAETLLNVISIIDAPVVIGGGLSGANDLFFPMLIEKINTVSKGLDGSEIRRLESRVFNLEQEQEFEEFAKKGSKEIILPESNRKVYYQQEKKIGIGLSTLGTNKAVMLGAYYYAVNKL